MQLQRTISLIAAAILLALPSTAFGQGMLRLTFDQPPAMPPGTSWQLRHYNEYDNAGVISVISKPPTSFTRRWSGDSLFPDNGTAYLQPRQGTELVVMDGRGRLFDLVSVDLAEYGTSAMEPVVVKFTGYSYGGLAITTAEFTTAGVVDSLGRPAFQTFQFGPEFSRVYSVGVTPGLPLWSLDNLVMYIPEPSAGALFALGTLALCLLRRRFSVRSGCTQLSRKEAQAS